MYDWLLWLWVHKSVDTPNWYSGSILTKFSLSHPNAWKLLMHMAKLGSHPHCHTLCYCWWAFQPLPWIHCLLSWKIVWYLCNVRYIRLHFGRHLWIFSRLGKSSDLTCGHLVRQYSVGFEATSAITWLPLERRWAPDTRRSTQTVSKRRFFRNCWQTIDDCYCCLSVSVYRVLRSQNPCFRSHVNINIQRIVITHGQNNCTGDW